MLYTSLALKEDPRWLTGYKASAPTEAALTKLVSATSAGQAQATAQVQQASAQVQQAQSGVEHVHAHVAQPPPDRHAVRPAAGRPRPAPTTSACSTGSSRPPSCGTRWSAAWVTPWPPEPTRGCRR